MASHLAFRQVYTVLLQLIANFQIQPASGQHREASDPLMGLLDKKSLKMEPSDTRARFLKRASVV